MPTDNRRIATYLPKEIDEKFRAFKEERGLVNSNKEAAGDSKALILIMSEYFGVNQQVSYSSDSPLAKQIEELSSLVSELKSELSTKVGENRISELKSELLGELDSRLKSKSISESPKQLDILPKTTEPKPEKKPRVRKKSTTKSKEIANGVDTMTTTQLAAHLKITNDTLSKAKSRYKNDVDRFIRWSYDRGSDKFAWEFRSGSSLFYRTIPF